MIDMRRQVKLIASIQAMDGRVFKMQFVAYSSREALRAFYDAHNLDGSLRIPVDGSDDVIVLPAADVDVFSFRWERI
jgi:hypothetical protein